MSALTQPCRRGAEGNGVCAVMSCPWMSREHKLSFTSPKQASVMVSIKRQEAKFCGGTKPAWHQLKTVHNKPCSLSPFHCSKMRTLIWNISPTRSSWGSWGGLVWRKDSGRPYHSLQHPESRWGSVSSPQQVVIEQWEITSNWVRGVSGWI